MKRFWKEARADDGTVLLDGKPVRTPKRNPLALPTSALAKAIAAEWNAVGEELDPRTLPLTGLANAAIDIVEPDRLSFAAQLAKYGETDLLAYRAESPPELVARQAAEWDPLLDWVRARYDVHVEIVTGIMHRPQPAATVARLRDATIACGDFELAALSPLVTIGGSLIAGLAVLERAFDAGTVWAAVNLDELWQEEQWGADLLAEQARESRRRDWDVAVRFLGLHR
ncbi:ATP12 family chaperone protein [Sphingomonas tabacisoli]|uniref:ATP12 family chaperone protein n=1 Tax=Sphingomonas tabacisoli TaxID=2249466 RepID=A0ABW4HZ24_9SPHN